MLAVLFFCRYHEFYQQIGQQLSPEKAPCIVTMFLHEQYNITDINCQAKNRPSRFFRLKNHFSQQSIYAQQERHLGHELIGYS